MKENIIDILQARGFIDAITSEELRAKANQPMKVYCGFDPTADSLHLGNLVGIIGLAWFQRYGHTPVAIVGGATGMIGDPSGKSVERVLLSPEKIEENLKGIRKNLEAVLKQSSQPFLLLNNYDWFKHFSLINFLRDFGKYFRVGPMLAKESVKKRMESEEGLSFTEFTYQILQGYDFLYLYENHEVNLQIGGSDQWGNITAGTELIRKVKGETAYGLTFPLIVKSDGQKFGKSEKGAIWLSPERLSPYEFYQYLFRTTDADVIQLLRMLTFVPIDEIRYLEASMKLPDYVPNSVQKRLAQEVTKIVHGEEALNIALKVTEAAAPGSETKLNGDTLRAIAKDMPSQTLGRSEVVGEKLLQLFVKTKMMPSMTEARKMLLNRGIYLNNQMIEDKDRLISNEDLIEENLLLLAVGKKNKLLLQIEK